MADLESVIHFYTDGSCLGNPGPGGWAYVSKRGGGGDPAVPGTLSEASGRDPATTNNKMELLATIKALASLGSGTIPAEIHLTTDSRYVRDGITQWIVKWKRNGWQTSNKKPVKNKELWQRLDALQTAHKKAGATLAWHWVKGHAGHPENTRADQLAREAAESAGAV